MESSAVRQNTPSADFGPLAWARLKRRFHSFIAVCCAAMVFGVFFGTASAAAQAPPPPPANAGEVEVVVSCLAGNGRIDVHVANTDLRLNPEAVSVTYEATVGTVASRRATVAFGDRHRFSVTGRPDGPIAVTVTGRGISLRDSTEAVLCDADDPTSAPVTVETSCLAGNGRFDVRLRNATATTQNYLVEVSGLTPRSRTVEPGRTGVVSVTGRPDGSYGVIVSLVTATGSAVVFEASRLPVFCDPIESLVPSVRRSMPHDTEAFTQGLVFDKGRLFESTGSAGSGTSIREVDPSTGSVLRIRDFNNAFFGEGIAVVGDQIWMLSWRNSIATVLDLETFATERVVTYGGEGWGLCFDGTYLVMSDGTDQIDFRNPETFEVERSIRVTRAGVPVTRINELDCVSGKIWANVWMTDDIIEINRATGVVETVVDASALGLPRPARGGAVLNGIAWNPGTGNWLVTGKLWPNFFIVDFVDFVAE